MKVKISSDNKKKIKVNNYFKNSNEESIKKLVNEKMNRIINYELNKEKI